MSARAKPRTDLENLIFRRVGQAIGDHDLIRAGDRIAVAVEGGFRSFILLSSLDLHRRRSPHAFTLQPIFISGLPGPDETRVRERLSTQGFSLRVHPAESGAPGSPARLRRRALTAACARWGLNKLACADSLDDFLRVLLGNLFCQGRLAAMAVHLPARTRRPETIRPLAYVEAEHLRRFGAELGIAAWGGGEDETEPLGALIGTMARSHPRVRRSMLAALKHARPDHLLAKGLKRK